jgi:hypothetical protein
MIDLSAEVGVLLLQLAVTFLEDFVLLDQNMHIPFDLIDFTDPNFQFTIFLLVLFNFLFERRMTQGRAPHRRQLIQREFLECIIRTVLPLAAESEHFIIKSYMSELY